jgi:2-dehydro-3-deoxygalactonokinase
LIFTLILLKKKLAEVQEIEPSTPIVISGMASSSIGLKELEYGAIPLKIQPQNLYIEQILASSIPNPILLISGLRSDNDVMRGEEVQFLGLHSLIKSQKVFVFIFPGTHSKHIFCDHILMTDFKTYMTGELFEVISKNTILSNSIAPGEFSDNTKIAFEKGVRKAKASDAITTALFSIRTNTLFNKQTKTENFYFLSGLLIGEELKNIGGQVEIILCADHPLHQLYEAAILILGLKYNTNLINKKTLLNSIIIGQNMALENTPL